MKIWKLSTFDLFSLDMVIKGAWVYKELADNSVLQASLDAVLQPYPQLLGKYDEKLKSAVWSGREDPIELVELDRKGHSVSEDMYKLVPRFNVNGFKCGKSRALEAFRIKLDDGVAIVQRLRSYRQPMELKMALNTMKIRLMITTPITPSAATPSMSQNVPFALAPPPVTARPREN